MNIKIPQTREEIKEYNKHIPKKMIKLLQTKYEIYDILNNQNVSASGMLYIPNKSAYRIYQKTGKKIHAMLIYQGGDITISNQNQIKIRNIIEHYDFTFDDSIKIINNQRKISDKSNNFLKDFYINDRQDNSGVLLIRKKNLKA